VPDERIEVRFCELYRALSALVREAAERRSGAGRYPAGKCGNHTRQPRIAELSLQALLVERAAESERFASMLRLSREATLGETSDG
jgi:hypothetical protein